MGLSDDEKKKIAVICCCFWVTALAVLITTLLVTSITTIENSEYGVENKVFACRIDDNILEEGRQVHSPFSEILRWPKVYNTLDQNIQCNSRDGLRIQLLLSFQYVPLRSFLPTLTRRYKNYEKYRDVVISMSRSSFRHTCSMYTAEDYQLNRSGISAQMETLLVERLNTIYTDVVELQLGNIERPRAFEVAVQDAESARTNIQLSKNKRDQELVNANTVLSRAYQIANETLDKAATEEETIQIDARNRAESTVKLYVERGRVFRRLKVTHELPNRALLELLKNSLYTQGKISVKKLV